MRATRWASGCPRTSWPAAADWFEKAALQGHPEAQYRLGLLYEEGRVVAQNRFETFFWFQSAADQGHLESQFKTGVAYAEGIGIGEDPKKAATWLLASAERDHAGAMVRLAELYDRGEGVAKDPEAAARWKAMAATIAPEEKPGKTDVQIVILDKAPMPGGLEAALDPRALETMERLLAGLGFEPSPVDGAVTDETVAAIRLYQAFAGLEVDDRPSALLLEELRQVSQTAGLKLN